MWLQNLTQYAKYNYICEIISYNSEKDCSILVSCELLRCFCTLETEIVGITFLFQNPYFIMSFGWLNLNWFYSCKFQNNAWIYLKCRKEVDELAYNSCFRIECNIVIDRRRAWRDARRNYTRHTVCPLRLFACSRLLLNIFKNELGVVTFYGFRNLDYSITT